MNQKLFLGWQFSRLKKNYHHRLHRDCNELSVCKYLPILSFLKQSPKGVSQKQISEQLSIDKANLVRNLDYFIENKIIERVKCKEDKRKNYLYLTKKGERESQKLEEINHQLDEKCKENIKASDWETFLKVMNQINKNLMEQN